MALAAITLPKEPSASAEDIEDDCNDGNDDDDGRGYRDYVSYTILNDDNNDGDYNADTDYIGGGQGNIIEDHDEDVTTDTRIADCSNLAGEEVDLGSAKGDDGHRGDLLLEANEAAKDLGKVGDNHDAEANVDEGDPEAGPAASFPGGRGRGKYHLGSHWHPCG